MDLAKADLEPVLSAGVLHPSRKRTIHPGGQQGRRGGGCDSKPLRTPLPQMGLFQRRERVFLTFSLLPAELS